METPENRWISFVKRFHSKRAMSVLAIVTIVLAIPVTVSLVQTLSDIRQRAAMEMTPDSLERGSSESVTYPWQYSRAANTSLPVVTTATRSLVATRPFSAVGCKKRSSGDADCNNTIDEGDLSFWQIDYEKHTANFADFNRDGKVTLADYNIWRQNAGISPTPTIQKISTSLGFEKIFGIALPDLFPSFHFQVFAQEAVPALNDSFLQLYADSYRIFNRYTDGSYSIQFNEIKNSGGQMTYYDASGNSIMQISNYVENSATVTSLVNGNTIMITQNPNGAMLQTILDPNGNFRSAQVWSSTASYAHGNFPQAVTLPIANGFTTVSLLPNNGAQVLNRDTSGNVVSYSVITDSTVSIYDYTTQAATFSNSTNGSTLYSIKNNLKGETTYTFSGLTVVSTKVTDNKGTSSVITSPLPGQFHIVTTDSAGKVATQDSADPMTVLGVDSLSPAAMSQSAQQYASTPNAPATSFSTGFTVNGQMPVQIAAVNRLLAIQNVQPAVLGAHTTKAVLAAGDDIYTAASNARDQQQAALREADIYESLSRSTPGVAGMEYGFAAQDSRLAAANYGAAATSYYSALNGIANDLPDNTIASRVASGNEGMSLGNNNRSSAYGHMTTAAEAQGTNRTGTEFEAPVVQQPVAPAARPAEPAAPAARPAGPAGAPATAPATQPTQSGQPAVPAAAQQTAQTANNAVQQAEAQYTVHHRDGTENFDGTRGERSLDAGLDYNTPAQSVPSDWSPSEHGAGSPLDDSGRNGGEVNHIDHPDQGSWGGSSGNSDFGRGNHSSGSFGNNNNNNNNNGGGNENNTNNSTTTTTITGAGPANEDQGGGGGNNPQLDVTIDSSNNGNDNNSNQGNSYSGDTN